MFPVTHLLRLILLLLVPLWLSLGAEALGLRLPFANVLSGWMHTRPPVDPTLVPPPGWREATYLDANPDIAAAVRSGGLVSGYAHYVRYGRAEGRPGGLPDDRSPEAAPARLEARLPEQPPEQPQPLERQSLAESQRSEPPKAEPASAGGASATRTPPTIPAASPGAPAGLPQTAMAQTAPEQPAPEQPPAPSPATKPTPPPVSPPVTPPPAPPLAPLPAVKPAAPQAQEATIQVSGLRTGSSNGATRIVLDLDRAPRFETPVSRRDGTLTVLLPGTVWKTSPTGRLPAAGWSYRAEPAGGASRLIVLGAESGPATLKAIFAMPPEGDRGHRLVIDLALPPSKAKPARTAAAEQKRT